MIRVPHPGFRLSGRRGVLAAGIAACASPGCSAVNVLNALAPARLFRDGVAFGPEPHQRLDVYRPAGAGRFPVAVFLYGGGWTAGNRAMYRFVGDALAAAGVLTMIPDYRLFPLVRYPVFLQDCAAAVAWTCHEAGRYGGRGGPPWLFGHSAGAYNAAMLTLDDRWLGERGLSPRAALRGTIALSGPYDFLPLHEQVYEEIFAPATPIKDSQPITHASVRAPPMLLLAGKADTTVDPGNTVRLAARLRALGGPVQARLYPGVDHDEIIGAFAGSLRLLAPSLRDSLAFMGLRG